MKVKWFPMPGKVAIVVADADEKIGNLYIPASAREQRTIGRVVATYEPFADGEEVIEAVVQVGDRVVFGKFSGTEVVVAGERVIILREQDILTKVEFLEEEES